MTANGAAWHTGYFSFPNLPADGLHTLIITPPAGYAVNGPATRQLSVQGADVSLPAFPLRPDGLTILQAFVDLDGDGEQDVGETGVGSVSVGLQQPDELVFRLPFTLTLSSAAGTQQTPSMGGRGFFLDLPAGAYTLAATTGAVQPQSFTLAVNAEQGKGLAVVAPGSVRGVAWLNQDGNGLRQAWEMPLAGLLVTLNGMTAVTDEEGRYVFNGVAPGVYIITASLPSGLNAPTNSAIVSEGRGAVAGIAAMP